MTITTLTAGKLSCAVLISTLALGGCATKKFVNEQVGLVDSRVTQVDGRLAQTDQTAKDALDRANAAHKLAEGKFLYTVVLNDDSVKFPSDASKLSPEAEAVLAQLSDRLKSENRNVYLEIQGHTDAMGAPDYNERLGQARAEAVRKTLNKDGVSLNRMASISYGEAAPVAPNDTREGRAQNRRVVIVVLS